MRYDLDDISKGLKNVCDARKITAVKLADWVDLAEVSVNKIFTGKRRPSVQKLFAILNVLDLSLEELLAYAELDSNQALELRETGKTGSYARSIESLLSGCTDEEKKSALQMLDAFVTQIKKTRKEAQGVSKADNVIEKPTENTNRKVSYKEADED